MRKPLSTPLLALLALAAAAPAASAYSVRIAPNGAVAKWAEPLVTYYLQMAGSDDLTPEESVLAVRNGFQSWTDVACATLAFEELGDAPNPKSTMLTNQGANGRNELVWIEDASWTLGAYVLGVTLPILNNDGFIIEADIAFNGYQVKWRTDSGSGTDLESVAVHEIGHMFGLQHNLGPFDWWDPPTMQPSIAGQNKSRSLEPDDQMAACFLYPVDGEFPCVEHAECPRIVGRDANGDEFYSGEFSCTDGFCANPLIYATGIANLGEECQQDAACAEGLYCQPWQNTGVCARYCETATPDCDAGFECNTFENYPKYGTCLPADGTIYVPGTGPLGCASSVVCGAEKSCLPTPKDDKRLCTTICQVDDPASCPEGERCWQYSEGKDTGACFAEALWPTVAPEPAPEPAPEAAPDAAGGEADAGPTPGEDATKAGDAGPGPLAEEPDAGGAAKGAVDDGCAAGGPGAPAGTGALASLLLLLAAVMRRRG